MLRERDVNTISQQSESFKKLHSHASGQLRQASGLLSSSSFSGPASSISLTVPSTTKGSSTLAAAKKNGNLPQMWSLARCKGGDGQEGGTSYTPKTNDERDKFLWGLFKTHSHFEYDVKEASVERGTREGSLMRGHQAAEGSNVVVNRRLTRGEFFSMVSSLRQSEFANRKLLEVTATTSTARVSCERMNRGGDNSTSRFGELELLMSSDQFAEVIWNRILKGGGGGEQLRASAAARQHASSVSWARVQRAFGDIFSPPHAPATAIPIATHTVAADEIVSRGDTAAAHQKRRGAADLNDEDNRKTTAGGPSSSLWEATKSTSPAPTDPMAMASCVDMVRENLAKSLQSSSSAKRTPSSVKEDAVSTPRLVSAHVKVLSGKPSRDEDERSIIQRGTASSTLITKRTDTSTSIRHEEEEGKDNRGSRHSHSNESSIIADSRGNSPKEQSKQDTATRAAAAQRKMRNTSASFSYFDPSPEPEWEAPYFEELGGTDLDHAEELSVGPAKGNNEEDPSSLDTIMRRTRRLLAGQSAKQTLSRRSAQKSNSFRAADMTASSPPRENNSRTAMSNSTRSSSSRAADVSNPKDNPSSSVIKSDATIISATDIVVAGIDGSTSTYNDDRQSNDRIVVSPTNTNTTRTGAYHGNGSGSHSYAANHNATVGIAKRRLPSVKYFEGEDGIDIIHPKTFIDSKGERRGRSVFGAELVRGPPQQEQLKSEVSVATADAFVDVNDEASVDSSTNDASFSDVPVMSITLALNTGNHVNSGLASRSKSNISSRESSSGSKQVMEEEKGSRPLHDLVHTAKEEKKGFVRKERSYALLEEGKEVVPSISAVNPRDFAFSPFRTIDENYYHNTRDSDAAHVGPSDGGVTAAHTSTHASTMDDEDEDKEDERDAAEYNEDALSALYEGLDSVSVPRYQRRRGGGEIVSSGGDEYAVTDAPEDADDGDNTFLRAPSERIIVNLDEDDDNDDSVFVSLTEEKKMGSHPVEEEVFEVRIEIPSPPYLIAQNNSRRASFNASRIPSGRTAIAAISNPSATAAEVSGFPTSFSSNSDDNSVGSVDPVAARGTRPPTPNERVGIKYGIATNANRLQATRAADDDRVTVNQVQEKGKEEAEAEEEIVLSPSSSIGASVVRVVRIERTAAHESFSHTPCFDEHDDGDKNKNLTTSSSSVVGSGFTSRSTSRALILSLVDEDEDDENVLQHQDAYGRRRVAAGTKAITAVNGNTRANRNANTNNKSYTNTSNVNGATAAGPTQRPAVSSSSSSLYKDRYALRLPTPSPSPSSTSIASSAAVDNCSTYTSARPSPPVDSSDLSMRMIMSPASEETTIRPERAVDERAASRRSASPSIGPSVVGVPPMPSWCIRRSVNLDESKEEEDDDFEKAAQREGEGEAFSPTSVMASPDSLSPSVPHVSKEVSSRELQRHQSLSKSHSRSRLVSPPRDDGAYNHTQNHHNHNGTAVPMPTASAGRQNPAPSSPFNSPSSSRTQQQRSLHVEKKSEGATPTPLSPSLPNPHNVSSSSHYSMHSRRTGARSRSSPQGSASPRSIFYSPSATARASTPPIMLLMSPRNDDESFNDFVEEDASVSMTTMHAESDALINNGHHTKRRSEGRGEIEKRYGTATDSSYMYAEYYEHYDAKDEGQKAALAASEGPSSPIDHNKAIATFTEANDESIIVGGDELSFVHSALPGSGRGGGEQLDGESYHSAETAMLGGILTQNRAAVVTELLAAGGIHLPLDAIAASPLKPSSYAPHALGPSTIVRSYSRAASPSVARPSSSSTTSTQFLRAPLPTVPLSLAVAQEERWPAAKTNTNTHDKSRLLSTSRRFTSSDTKPLDDRSLQSHRLMLGPQQDQEAVLSASRPVSSPSPVAATSRFSLQSGRAVVGVGAAAVRVSHSTRSSAQTMVRGAHSTPSSSLGQQRVAAYSSERSAYSSSTAYDSASSASYSCYTSSSCRSSSAVSASSSSSALPYHRYVESSQEPSSISPSRRSPSRSLDPLARTKAGNYGNSGEIQREFYDFDRNKRESGRSKSDEKGVQSRRLDHAAPDACVPRRHGLVMGPRFETTSTALDCVSPASTVYSDSGSPTPDSRSIGYDQEAHSYHSHVSTDHSGNSSEKRRLTRRFSLSDLDTVRKTSAPEPTTTTTTTERQASEAPLSPSHPRDDPLLHRPLPHSSYHRRSLSCPPLLNELLLASASSGEQKESRDARLKGASEVLNGHSDAPPRPTSLAVKIPPRTRPLPLAPKSHMQPLPKKAFNELSGGGGGSARTEGRVLQQSLSIRPNQQLKRGGGRIAEDLVVGRVEPTPRQSTSHTGSSTTVQPKTKMNKGDDDDVEVWRSNRHTEEEEEEEEEGKHFDSKDKDKGDGKDRPNAVKSATTGGGPNDFSSISPFQDRTKSAPSTSREQQEPQPQRPSSPRAVPHALSPSPKSRSASVGPPAGRGRVKTVAFAGKAALPASSSHLSVVVSPSSKSQAGRAAVEGIKSTTAISNVTTPSPTPSTKTSTMNEGNASSSVAVRFDWNSSPLPAERRITFPLSAERPPARRRLQSAERIGIHAPLYYYPSSSYAADDAGPNPHKHHQQQDNSREVQESKEASVKAKEGMQEKPHTHISSSGESFYSVSKASFESGKEKEGALTAFSNDNNASATASAPPPFLQPSTAPPSLSASPAPRSSRNRETVEEEEEQEEERREEVLQSTVAHFSSSSEEEKVMGTERTAFEAEEELAKKEERRKEVSIDNDYEVKSYQQQVRASSLSSLGSPHFPSRSPPRLPSPSLSTQRPLSRSVHVSAPLMTTHQTSAVVSTSSSSSFVELYLRQAQALIVEGGGGEGAPIGVTEEATRGAAHTVVNEETQQYQLAVDDVQRDGRRDLSSLSSSLHPLQRSSLDVPQQPSYYDGSRQSSASVDSSSSSYSYVVSRRLSLAASSMCSAADIVVLDDNGRDFRSRNRVAESMSPPSHAPPPPPTLEVSYSEGSFAHSQKRNEPTTTTKRVPLKVLRRINRTIAANDKNDERRSNESTVEPSTDDGSQHEQADSSRQNPSQTNRGAEEGVAVKAEGVRRSGPPSLPPSFLRAHQLMPHGPNLVVRGASPASVGGNITPRASSVDSTASSTKSIVRTPPTTRVVVGPRN